MKKGTLTLLLSIVTLTLMAVVGDAFASKTEAVGFGGDSGVPKSGLPILGWWGIPERFVSRERYREAREAGFTHIMQHAESVERMLAYLDMAHVEGMFISAKMPLLHTEPEKVAKALMDHPALSMYHIEDEPPAQRFAKLSEIMKRIKAIDAKHPCYVNLLADSSDPIRYLGVADYGTYLKSALREMDLPLISADYYPCILEDNKIPQPFHDEDDKVVLKKLWFRQMEILAAASKRTGLPLSLFACDVAHLNGRYLYPIPKIAHLRLQQYVNLAYGAMSLQYFTYWSPYNVKPHYFHESIIRLDGTRGEVYDIVRAFNRELHARAPQFIGAKVENVSHTGTDLPIGVKKLEKLPSWVKGLDTSDGGAVVSQMRRGNEEILMIVNRSPVKTMPLRIVFENAASVTRVLDDGRTANANKYGSVYRVAPGYAEIFKVNASGPAECTDNKILN